MAGDWEKAVKYTDDTKANEVAADLVTAKASITQNANAITAEVSRATGQENILIGQIDILAGNITLKVSSNQVIAAINLSPEEVKISANKITLEGVITANNNFKINLDGSIEAVNAKFSGLVEGSVIKGSTIEGGQFSSSAWDGNTYGVWYEYIDITSGAITAGRTIYQQGQQSKEISSTLKFNSLTTGYVYAQIGNSSDKKNAYINEARVDKLYIGSYEFKPTLVDSLYAAGSPIQPRVRLTTSKELLPGDYSFSIGNSNNTWDKGYIDTLYIDEIYVGGTKKTFLAASDISALYATTAYYATLDSSRAFVPNANSSSYPFSIGSSSYPWTNGYFKNIYQNGNLINTLYSDSSFTITLNSSRELVPSSSSTSYPFDLGNSSYPWTDLHIKNIFHKSGGTLGLFGATPVTKTAIADLATGSTLEQTVTKLRSLIDVLQAYGLI
ncbi:MAG: p20 [Herbinix sp.]|nr:p20 [Herbinix sp.]